MVMTISIDSYDVARQMKTISDKNPNLETAIAGGGKVIDGTRVFLQHVLEYDGASKQQWQVSISSEVQEHTHEKLAAQWYDTVAQWHQHLEKYDHAHDFSEQDEKAIENQQQPVHLLLYKTEDSVRVKAVDTDMKPVPFVVKGVTMDIINIFDGKVEEYREAA
jgi:hypothetical protein